MIVFCSSCGTGSSRGSSFFLITVVEEGSFFLITTSSARAIVTTGRLSATATETAKAVRISSSSNRVLSFDNAVRLNFVPLRAPPGFVGMAQCWRDHKTANLAGSFAGGPFGESLDDKTVEL